MRFQLANILAKYIYIFTSVCAKLCMKMIFPLLETVHQSVFMDHPVSLLHI